MFEVQTYDVILRRLLKRLPENEDIRPSSPLYILSGPAAKEFETVYGELDYTLNQVFPTTAGREYLIRDAKTYEMAPFAATKAVVEGEFNIEIDIGTRFSRDGVGFIVARQISKPTIENFYYELECEVAGETGNVISGVLIPDWNIPDLTRAQITRVLIPGEEEEDTESFRERYLASFTKKSFGGNLSDYIEKVISINGVGRCKILRCANINLETDPEWVGIVFTNSEDEAPTQELIDTVQEEMQPLGVTGLPELETSGLGLAPIGHLVWVDGVKNEEISVGLNITYESEYNWDRIRAEVESRISSYFHDLSAEWGGIAPTTEARRPFDTFITIGRSKIESMILEIDGVIDANDTIINGEFKNLKLAWNKLPVLKEVYEHDETEIRDGKNTCPYNCPDCQYERNAAICPRIPEK